jgi:formylglycine-generating enzyme required for sulfatase activity
MHKALLIIGGCFLGGALSNFANAAESNKAVEAKVTVELLKTFRQEFVPLTPGENQQPGGFQMGRGVGGSAAERPRHEVKLSRPFYMAKYEVPQNLWSAVMGSNPSKWSGPRNSVEMLSHAEAVQFCQKATELMRAAKLIAPDEVIRLPNEAEWEYAARAGTATVYSFGDDPDDLADYGWFHANAAGNDPPVGAKEPNAWKLYDMHGYLWEWCSDPWHENYAGAPVDGSVWSKGGIAGKYVLRGGSWKDAAESLSSSFRRAGEEHLRDDAVGLRCALSKEQK